MHIPNMVCAQQTKIPWCGYNRAITTGEVYKHKNTLPSEVLHCIKDVYGELSTPNLLAKCLHVPVRNGSTLNIRRVTSPLVSWRREVQGLEHPPEGFPLKLGWNRDKSYSQLHGAQSCG
ncbi:hypothetical protein TNCV_3912761 [Trichonephila clavipes]|nr:hypothetical protein TNCV_3912761 [Trichonephila clavipes]